MPKWTKTQYPGVRYREHPTRKHGRQPDRYYVITYKLDGKTKDEAIGWASEKVKPSDCHAIYCELKENRRKGEGPRTLAEKRGLDLRHREAEKKRSVTLGEYWTSTYFPFAKQRKGERSWKREESLYRMWIAPSLEAIPLREIDLQQWDDFVRILDDADLSQRSKEYATGTLRRILKHAYERRIISQPPPSGKRIGVTAPRDNRRLRVIRPDEMRSILEELAAHDPSAHKLTLFAWLTGCRLGEAGKLQWKDVDLASKHLTFRDTKNKDSRTIGLEGELLELLSGIPEQKPTDHVFASAQGIPYTETPSAFRTTVERLGLNEGRTKKDRLVFHSIRHTVATELAKSLNPRDLMEVMGWRTVEVAMRYVHGNESAKRNALASLGNVLDDTKGKIIPFKRAGGGNAPEN